MKRPTSNDFVLLFRTYWDSYDAAIQSYCQDLEDQFKAERESVDELSLHCQDLELRLKRAEDGIRNIKVFAEEREEISVYIANIAWACDEILKDLGKEDRMTNSIDPVVRGLRHAEEIIAKGPNGPAWPDISSHQIKAKVKP